MQLERFPEAGFKSRRTARRLGGSITSRWLGRPPPWKVRGRGERPLVWGSGALWAWNSILGGTAHIMTNLRLLKGAKSICAVYPGGEKYTGEVIAGDPKNDIAIVML